MERRSILGRGIPPIFLDRIPEFEQAFVISVAVLHDERLYMLGVFQRETVSDGRTVIHYVERVLVKFQLFGELIHDIGVVPECVWKLLVIRHAALPEAGIVRGYNVE